MNKKTEELGVQLDNCYAEQGAVYQEILGQCVDPNRTAVLLRQLEANNVRRQNLQRQIDQAIAKGPETWVDKLFKP